MLTSCSAPPHARPAHLLLRGGQLRGDALVGVEDARVGAGRLSRQRRRKGVEVEAVAQGCRGAAQPRGRRLLLRHLLQRKLLRQGGQRGGRLQRHTLQQRHVARQLHAAHAEPAAQAHAHAEGRLAAAVLAEQAEAGAVQGRLGGERRQLGLVGEAAAGAARGRGRRRVGAALLLARGALRARRRGGGGRRLGRQLG
jgi:hypothetical protein